MYTRTLLLGSFAALGTLDFGGICFSGICFGGIRCRFGSGGGRRCFGNWRFLGGAGSLGLNKGITEHGVDGIGS